MLLPAAIYEMGRGPRPTRSGWIIEKSFICVSNGCHLMDRWRWIWILLSVSNGSEERGDAREELSIRRSIRLIICHRVLVCLPWTPRRWTAATTSRSSWRLMAPSPSASYSVKTHRSLSDTLPRDKDDTPSTSSCRWNPERGLQWTNSTVTKDAHFQGIFFVLIIFAYFAN